ncbi:LON peptidase substrate-binding domain-containing protein [Streptomyces sp. NPDC058657]|uniref:LON peptidase substrate-binding domain-containing protein n=1 Tax=unclassified Streptomyces TaxID=2593676 RepID=UPI00365DA173
MVSRPQQVERPLRLSIVTTVRLPLFPLNSVLFPGLVLPLNVFEERYRAMMRDLLKSAPGSGGPDDGSAGALGAGASDDDGARRFAVVAIRDGRETARTATGMPDDPTVMSERGPSAGFGKDPIQAFHRVGCVADAATIREREDGSFEVLATGTKRVRLLSVDASGPYLVAELEGLEEDPGDEAGALAEGVLRAFRQYQKRLAGAREATLTTSADLPDEPSVVSYLVAAATMLDTPTRQRLLQAPDTATRLREELTILRSETALIRHLPSIPAEALTRAPTCPN